MPGEGKVLDSPRDKWSLAVGCGMLVMLLLFLAGIVWVNLHEGLWVNFDQYFDMNFARVAFREKRIFPENWIFGNQYYVAATPVLAAAFYGVFRDIFLAMGAASCVMTALVLISFVWCFKPAANRFSLLAGCLVLVGGGIWKQRGTRQSGDAGAVHDGKLLCLLSDRDTARFGRLAQG